MSKDLWTAFTIVAAVRVVLIAVDSNYEWPDQRWQGPEIAYKMATGYGYESWEWIMEEPIRSPIYQLFLSLGYRFTLALNLPDCVVEASPKFMQTLLACLCDWFLLKMAHHYLKKISLLTYLCILTNWFYFSMMNRTYINSAEACLTTIAFYLWAVKRHMRRYDIISRLLVGLCYIMRPTSIMLWVVVWPYELFRLKKGKLRFIAKNILTVVLMVLSSLGVNSLWYGKFAWVDYNFFKYNILLKWSELYGVNPYFYYVYASIPFIFAGYLIPLVLSATSYALSFKFFFKKTQPKEAHKDDDEKKKKKTAQIIQSNHFWELFIICLLTLVLLSFSTHKQHRFLLIIVPLLLILTIKGFKKLKFSKVILTLILLVNFVMFFTIAIYGKTGGFDILRDLRQQIDSFPIQERKNVSVMYLCEPHSLPLYSILMRNVSVSLLDTSPIRKLQNFKEQYELVHNPQIMYNSLLQNNTRPTFLITQQKYALHKHQLRETYLFLLSKNYKIVSTHRHITFWQQSTIGWDGFILFKQQ